MTTADVFSQQFRIRLHVNNPNDRELAIESIEYELFLQGDSFAEGNSDASFVVPAKGEAEFDTLVQTHFMSSVARLLTKMGSDGQVQYDFIGKVHLSKGFMRNVPFNERGMVNLGLKK
jgi:LEA14-like dessication related protein